VTVFLKKSRLCFFAEAAIEFINTTCGIDEFLFAGEEGMAFCADTDFDFGTGAFDVPDFAASADDFGITVSGMDVFFHFSNSVIFKV
jgi:hypothetical protein